jgi:hypothetical protein
VTARAKIKRSEERNLSYSQVSFGCFLLFLDLIYMNEVIDFPQINRLSNKYFNDLGLPLKKNLCRCGKQHSYHSTHEIDSKIPVAASRLTNTHSCRNSVNLPLPQHSKGQDRTLSATPSGSLAIRLKGKSRACGTGIDAPGCRAQVNPEIIQIGRWDILPWQPCKEED